MENRKSSILASLVDSIPIGAAYFPLGVVWGFLWMQAGLPSLWAIAFSATVYAGAVQFIALSMIVSGAPLISILIAAIPIAIRNCFYTSTANHILPGGRFQKMFGAFAMVDANFAILMSKPLSQARNPWYHYPLAFCTQLYWILGTACGVFNLFQLPEGLRTLDFSLPALLTCLVIDQIFKVKSIRPVIWATILGAISILTVGSHWFVPAIVLCLVVTLYGKKETAVS